MEQTQETTYESFRAGTVHFVLSHSYTVFLGAVILGICMDLLIPMYVFNTATYQYTGFAMIVLGSALIYWAQSTSRCVKKEVGDERTEKDFERGPYKYSRNPTHIGLSVMTLGLAFLLNSPWSIIFIVITAFITKFIFLKKEETLLEKKYGQAYCDYKNKVGTWV